MYDLDGSLDVGGADDARDADRRGRDDLDVHAGLRERVEHVRRDAGMALHPRADQRHLPDVGVTREACRVHLGRDLAQDRLGGGNVVLRQRERDVRVALGRDVLHDHVDVHAGVRERTEARAAIPGRSGTPRIVAFASDVSCAIPEMIALSSPSGSVTTRVPSAAENDERTCSGTPWLRAYSTARSIKTLAPGGEVEHLLVRHRVQLARLGDDPRVGREDPLDVGVDLADVGGERGRKRHGGRVGAAAPECRTSRVRRDSLEAGDDRDAPGVERIADTIGAHRDDARAAVRGVGDDARLQARERHGVTPQVVDRHRQERDRDLLAGGEEHVALAGMRAPDTCPASSTSSSVVSPIAETTTHTCAPDEAVATDALGDAKDPLRARDGAAAVLLDDERHVQKLSGAGRRRCRRRPARGSSQMPIRPAQFTRRPSTVTSE